ncbi:MAG: hypothetical protein IKP71_12115, partial [Candidatus Riflebacteria bacterium]|nr:hypothetical protein [Candidatus Riflebacteria bacterium]
LVIDDILRYFKKLGKKLEIEKSFNVENRDWKELFTQSALRNKETYEMMMGNGNKGKIASDTSEGLLHHCNASHCSPLSQQADSSPTIRGGASKGNYPERVSAYLLRSFLEEPFKARIDRILLSEDEEDAEKIEFEPIVIDKLKESIIKKQLVLNGLKGFTNLEEKIDEIIAEQSIEFPQGKFGDKVKIDLINISNDYINHIRSRFKDKDYSYKSLNLSVDLENIIKGIKFIWNLSGTANIAAENEKELHIIDLVTSKDIYPKNYLNAYILSLIYITITNKEKKEVYIDLFKTKSYIPQKGKNKGKELGFVSVKIDCCSEYATKILNDIYLKTFVNNYHKVLPIDLFKEENLDYHKYIEIFDDEYGPWGYFSVGKLFDIRDERISGFTEDNFKNEWGDEKDNQLELFPKELRQIFLPDVGGKK